MQTEAGDFADVRRQIERGEPLFGARLDVDTNQLPLRVVERNVLGNAGNLIPGLGEPVRSDLAVGEVTAHLAVR